jgi:hypothetical protein
MDEKQREQEITQNFRLFILNLMEDLQVSEKRDSGLQTYRLCKCELAKGRIHRKLS